MENKKQILSMQLNVDDFAPASDSEKESLCSSCAKASASGRTVCAVCGKTPSPW